MNIGVCVKITPDTSARVKPEGDSFDVSGKTVVSPYDMFAIEEAIQAKEKHGGAVNAYTVGGEKAVLSQLRGSCLALGADKAVIIDDAAMGNATSLGVAKALAAAIKADDIHLVFCGKQAIDDDNVQVPAMVAALLGWAQVSRVVEFSVEGDTFTATRAMDGGVKETVTGALPAVITAERGLNTPRRAKLPAIMKAKKKPVVKHDLAALGLTEADVASKITASNYGLPPARTTGRMLEGDTDTMVAELVRLLREEAKVL